ncbi:MAG: FecR domain-containing protein [Rhodospirillales bacterium]|nr:FecR domain-containing protein [Rhodospirillales bacterium]
MRVANGFSVDGSFTGTGATSATVLEASGQSSIVVPGADFILTAHYARIGSNLILTSPDGETEFVVRDYFASETPPDLFGDTGVRVTGDLAARLSGPLAPGQYAQAGSAAGSTAQSDSIGRVETVTGTATATHADGTRVTLGKDSVVHAGDIIETGAGASIGIVFMDKTTFAVGENARMVLDEMIFDPGNNNVSSVTSLLQGAFVIITGEIGKLNPQAVVINTPAAQIGIRGTGMAFDIHLSGAVSTYTLLFGAITVLNTAAQILLDNPLNSVTFTSFNQPPGPVFPLSQDQFDSLFSATKAISDQLAPFSVNLGEINPGAGGNDPADGVAGGGVGPNISGGALSDPLGSQQPGGPDFFTIGVLPPPLTPPTITLPPTLPPFEPTPILTSTGTTDGPTLITGTEGGETLTGGDGPTTIIALGGNDILIGAGGNDILIGGPGNDIIDGGAGSDVAVYSGNIADYSIGPGQTGFLVTDNRDVAPSTSDGTDSLVNVETFAFADAIYDVASGNIAFFDPPLPPPDLALITGTEFGETLTGDANANTIIALGGNDILIGLGGADIFFGGEGNDTIDGGAGLDSAVYSGLIADYSITNNGNGTFDIDDFRDLAVTEGFDVVTNVETIIFADAIFDTATGNTVSTLPPPAGTTVLEFDAVVGPGSNGVNAAEFVVGDTLHARIEYNSTITDGNPNTQQGLYSGAVTSFILSFAGSGQSWTIGPSTPGTIQTFNDEISGASMSDQVFIIGGSGVTGSPLGGIAVNLIEVDFLDFETSPTTPLMLSSDALPTSVPLNDGDLSDSNFFSIGTSAGFTSINFTNIVVSPPPLPPLTTITGTSGADTLNGTAGIDAIDGLAGNDNLIGNGGNDILLGGLGNDTYSFFPGDGVDVISDAGGFDILELNNLNDSVTNVMRVGDDLNVSFSDGGGITAIGHFAGTGQEIEQVSFPTTQEVLNIRANGIDGSDDLVVGGPGADNLVGMSGSDVLAGGGGDDTLDGGIGNDDIRGGAGSDILTGGAGSDFFSWISPGELTFHNTDTLRGPDVGDTIMDFTSGLGGDIIEFNSSAFGFNGSFTLTEGLNFHTITAAYDGNNSGHNNANPNHFVYSTADQTLYYDNDPAAAGYSIVATVAAGSDNITASDVEIFQPGLVAL